MKTILYTAYDDKYAPLAELTVPLMRAYANKHGMDFSRSSEPALHTKDGIYWSGVVNGLKLLKHYDRIIWLDVDQMITNPEKKFTVPISGFHASKDWGADAIEPWHFSMCGFIAHKDCMPIFEECLSMEPDWRDRPFPEQGPMRDAIRRQINWTPHPQRLLNAVPNEVCPGKVVDPWQPGDFAAHLTMLPVPERIKLFHEIENRILRSKES